MESDINGKRRVSEDIEIAIISRSAPPVLQSSPRDPTFSILEETRDFGDELTPTEEEFFKIVQSGTPKEVEDFLNENAKDININNKDGEFHTVLQVAVLRRNVEIVKLLLKAGCKDPYAVALAGALRFNDILQLLLAKGPPDSRLASLQDEGLANLDNIVPEIEGTTDNDKRTETEMAVDSRTVRRAVTKFKRPRTSQPPSDSSVPLAGGASYRPRSSDDSSHSLVTSSKVEEQDFRRMLKAAIDADDFKETKKLIELHKYKRFPKNALSLHCLCPKCRKTNEKEEECKDVLEEARDRLDVCQILASPTYILVTAPDPIWAALEWTTHLQSMAYWHAENKDEFLQLAAHCSQLAVDLISVCDDDKEVKLLFQVSYENHNPHFLVADNPLKYKRLHDAVGLLQKKFVTHPTCQHVLSKLWLGTYYTRWRRWSTLRRMWHIVCQILFAPIIFSLFVCKVKYAKDCLKAPLNRFIYAATSYSFFLVTVVANQYVDRDRNWPTPSVDGYDFVIGLWVLGFICKIITDFVTQRHFSYSRLWWGAYETIMIAFFIAGGITFILGYGPISTKVANWEVLFFSQGLYSVAMTLAFLRTLQWFHLSSTLGPLVISFSRMTVVLRRLLIIFCVVIISFSIGIYTIYRNFRPITPEDEEDSDEDKFFKSYLKTLKILFWAILGKGESYYASIPGNYQYAVRNSNFTGEYEGSFTVIVGYTLWTFFHIAVVVVLLNMLIAVMTHYYQIIQDNGDIEWKFARTKLRMYYIEKYSRFPPPVNIISMVYRLAKLVMEKYWKRSATDEVDAMKKSNEKDQHQIVVKELIKRHLHRRDLTNSREQRK